MTIIYPYHCLDDNFVNTDFPSLITQNKVGMKDSLVDENDFPRNDIDVWAVRTARNSIIRLENDAKALFDRMQYKLEELHLLTRPRQD